MVHALPVCLPALCFPCCLRGVSLVHGSCELFLSPLYAHLLQRLHLQLPPHGEGFAVLLQPPKAHCRALGRQPGGTAWLTSHQGLTLVAVGVIVHAGALLSSGGLGRPLVL